MDFAALFREQLHFLFDNLENHNLLILIEHTVATLVKDFQKLIGWAESQQVVEVVAFGIVD